MRILACLSFPARLALLGIPFAGIFAAIVAIWLNGAAIVGWWQPPAEESAVPVAVVDQREVDLGTIETDEACKHTFVIRNEGQAPLQLSRSETNCACTMTELPAEPIPPGGKAEIGISFKLKEKSDHFDRGATITTNDPEHERIILALRGRLRCRLAAEPAAISLSVQASEEKRSAQTFVYSQVWDAFEMKDIKCSLQGATWRIEPAGREKLEALDGRSGYRVEVTLPREMPDGQFKHSLDLLAQPAVAGEKPRRLQVDVQGNVYGRVTIHGQRIDANGVLRLGAIPAGQPVHENLIMKVHDRERELEIRGVETEPEFLRARVAPFQSGSAKIGLYRMEVELSADTPSCNFMAGQTATVRVKTDHPRLPVIELKVEFAVVGEGGGRHVAAR